MKELILAIDLGTLGCKVAAISINGGIKAMAKRGYKLLISNNAVEQDPASWWECVCHCINELGRCISLSNIVAVGVTGQSTSIIPVDHSGKPLRNAITYLDTRAYGYRRFFLERGVKLNFPEERMLTNIMWLRDHEPHVYNKVWKVMDAKEYIGFLLTKKPTIDAIAFRPNRLRMLCKHAKIPIEIFGEPHDYTRPIGLIDRNVARRLGLPSGIPVVIGPWDGMCKIIGSGTIDHGIAMNASGATEIIAVASSRKLDIVTHKHVINGLWLYYTALPTGIVMERLREMFNVNKLPSSIHSMHTGMYIVPLIHGVDISRGLRSAIIGLSPCHDVHDIIRSFAVGVAYMIRMIIDEIEARGLEVNEIRVCGGGARNMGWNIIKANVLGKVVKVPRIIDAGCLGIALITGYAINIYKDLAEAVRSTISIARVIKPDPVMHEKYSKQYKVFLKLIDTLRNILDQANTIDY